MVAPSAAGSSAEPAPGAAAGATQAEANAAAAIDPAIAVINFRRLNMGLSPFELMPDETTNRST
jgi:hypothetical protein